MANFYYCPSGKQGDQILVYFDDDEKHIIPLGSITDLEIKYRNNGNFRYMDLCLKNGNRVRVRDEIIARDVHSNIAVDCEFDKES